MFHRIAIALALAGCGLEHYPEDADLTEPTCWTENGSPALFWHVPASAEVSEELNNTCEELYNVHSR